MSRKQVTRLQISYAEQRVHREAKKALEKHGYGAFENNTELRLALEHQLEQWKNSTNHEDAKKQLAQLSWVAWFGIASDI